MENPQKGDIVLHRNGYRAKVENLNCMPTTDQGLVTLYDLKSVDDTFPRVNCLREDFTFPALENKQEVECCAYHEAAHMAIAAVYGLTLRPDGFMVDSGGHGISRYKTQPEESDSSREGVVVSSLAGFSADERYRAERSYPTIEPIGIIHSCDWRAARMVIEKLSAEYMPGDNKAMILFKLDKRSKNLVEKHWAVIQELANTLLAKDVQATKLLDDGNVWSNENTARFVTGAETVAILARHGIVTTCAAGEGSSAARRAANLPR